MLSNPNIPQKAKVGNQPSSQMNRVHPYHCMVARENISEAGPSMDAELQEWQGLGRGICKMSRKRGVETNLLNWNMVVLPQFARTHKAARWREGLGHFGSNINPTKAASPIRRGWGGRPAMSIARRV